MNSHLLHLHKISDKFGVTPSPNTAAVDIEHAVKSTEFNVMFQQFSGPKLHPLSSPNPHNNENPHRITPGHAAPRPSAGLPALCRGPPLQWNKYDAYRSASSATRLFYSLHAHVQALLPV